MLLLLLLLPQPQPPCHHWLTAHHCHSIPCALCCLQLLACAILPAFPGCCACSWRVLRCHALPADTPAEPSAGSESALASQLTASPPHPPTDVTTTTAASTGWDEGNWSDDDDVGADWGLGTPPAATAEAEVDVDALMARRDALLAARSKPAASSSASHGKSTACQQAGTPALDGTDEAATGAAAASAATGATAAAAPSTNDSGGTPGATPTAALAHSSFPSFLLAVDAEPYEAASASAPKADTSYELRLLAEYRQWEREQHGAQGEGEAAAGSIGSGATGGGAAADSASDDEDESPATVALKAYERRLARLPSQCLRYAYGGHPLWATTRPPKLSPPPCPCGAARVFEMQVSLPASC